MWFPCDSAPASFPTLPPFKFLKPQTGCGSRPIIYNTCGSRALSCACPCVPAPIIYSTCGSRATRDVVPVPLFTALAVPAPYLALARVFPHPLFTVLAVPAPHGTWFQSDYLQHLRLPRLISRLPVCSRVHYLQYLRFQRHTGRGSRRQLHEALYYCDGSKGGAGPPSIKDAPGKSQNLQVSPKSPFGSSRGEF